MATDHIASFVASLLEIPQRLQKVVNAYLLVLLLDGPKKTLSHAAALSGLHKSQFSRLLTNNSHLAASSLNLLAAEVAMAAGRSRAPLVKSCSWTIAIIIDATLHTRSSLHVQNSQRFNHGKGFVIGHQWTNIVLSINDQLIPLAPIPFWSKKECKRRGVDYKTEHVRLIEYLSALELSKYVGEHSPEEVVVMTDAGYDNKLIQRLILSKGWDFLTALKSSRSTQTKHENEYSPKSWRRISALFRAAKKQTPWQTVRVETDQGKKRKTFRVRKLIGRIKGIHHDVALICSEKSTGKGRRYFACSSIKASAGAITRAYRIRWRIEMFHRSAKSQLGMLDASVSSFDALTAHIHWVYCAYLLLQKLKIPDATSLLDKQRVLQKEVERRPIVVEIKRIVAARTQFGGGKRQVSLMHEALQTIMAS